MPDSWRKLAYEPRYFDYELWCNLFIPFVRSMGKFRQCWWTETPTRLFGVQTVYTSISAFLYCSYYSDKGNYCFILCKTVFWGFFCPNLFICWLLLRLGVELCPWVGTGQVTYKVWLRAQESVQYIGGVFWGPACRSQRGFSSAQGALCIFLYTWRLDTAPCLSLWLISRAHPMPT